MDCQLVLLLVAVVVGTQAATTKAPKTKIINSAEKCGTTHTVGLENEFLLSGNGQITAGTGTCAFTFNVEGSTCESMCYIFNQYSYFNDARARLSVGGQTYDKDYDITAVPVCVDGTSLALSLTLDSGYVYDKKNSGYKFDVTVYSKCGEKGSVTNIEFEEAIKDLNGYHHGKDREEREKMTFVTGIVLGFGLASIFLVVLLFGYCYTRNSPNRGPNRSAGMPKVGGFKKTMTPGTEPKEVEMGVRYQAKDPDRPEAAALLVGDPEKPPVEDHNDDDADDVKKPTSDVAIVYEKDTSPVPASSDGDGGGHTECSTTSGADHSGGGSGGDGGGISSSGGGGGGYSAPCSDSYSGGGGGGGYSGYSGGGGDSGGGGGGSSCGGGGGGGGGGGSDD